VNVTPCPGLFLATGSDAVVLAVAVGAAKIVTCGRLGGVRSLVHACVAGEGSAFPTGSIARTLKVCGPEPGTSTASGDLHAVNGAPSNEHRNVDAASVDVNANVAVVARSGPSKRAPRSVRPSVVPDGAEPERLSWRMAGHAGSSLPRFGV